MVGNDAFQESIREQIRINQARTPTQRFMALCELLDATRAMSPNTPEARERRLRILAKRQHEREQFGAHYRRLAAGHRLRSIEVMTAGEMPVCE
jgi:hypothetical protein